jgi:hypothetical protein
VRLHRDHDGRRAGTHLIAQIKHHGVRCHRAGRRQGRTVMVEACTEIAHGVRLVLAVL